MSGNYSVMQDVIVLHYYAVSKSNLHCTPTPNNIMLSGMALQTSSSKSEGMGDDDGKISFQLLPHGPEMASVAPAILTGVLPCGSPYLMATDDEINFQSPRKPSQGALGGTFNKARRPVTQATHVLHLAYLQIWQIACIMTWLILCIVSRHEKN